MSLADRANVWKVTAIVNMGDRGFLESYYLTNQSGEVRGTPAISRLMLARAKLLGGPPSTDPTKRPRLLAYTISQVYPAGGTITIRAGVDIQNANATNPVATFVEAGLNVRLASAGGLSKRFVLLRAMPDAWIPPVAVVNRYVRPIAAKFTEAFNNFVMEVTNKQQNQAPTTWAIKTYDRANPNPKVPIQEVIKTGNPAVYEYRMNSGTWTPGTEVRIAGIRGQGVKGSTGTGQVISWDQVDGWVNVGFSACDDCTPDPDNLGTMQRALIDYLPINSAQSWKWGKRDTGAAFFSTAGRRSGGCC